MYCSVKDCKNTSASGEFTFFSFLRDMLGLFGAGTKSNFQKKIDMVSYITCRKKFANLTSQSLKHQ